MSSYTYYYLDGNAAAGELSRIFAIDLTAAEGQCVHCGAIKRFAEALTKINQPIVPQFLMSGTQGGESSGGLVPTALLSSMFGPAS